MNVFETVNGRLFMDGVDLAELAAEFGTPLYVMSRSVIDDRIAELKRDFTERYPNARAAYASKAFLCTALCHIVDEAGLSLDVVSGGELFTSIRAKFPAERIEFHGNNKTRAELELAVGYGVGRIIVDAPGELDLIEDVVGSKYGHEQKSGDSLCAPSNDVAYRPRVLFRVNPDVESDTHDHISTGHGNSKFGFSYDSAELFDLIGRAIRSNIVDFEGIHFHVGSQLFTNDSRLAALRRALGILKEVKIRYGYDTPELNIGGGFAIRYTSDDDPRPFGFYLEPVMREVEEYCAAEGLKPPAVVVEPGRSIVGEAGVTLYTVGAIRETRADERKGNGSLRAPDASAQSARKFVAVDGGMTDNIRPALYGAKYEAVVANRADKPATEVVTVVGKCCESGDRLIEGARLQTVAPGDILAVYSTGAYGYSMASNYNKLPLPAVALVENGKARLIVRRQSYEDMLSRDLPL
ncbi:MAG: diaminopimelate decarboxylase [Clostridiales Family XIII bacterium]|jgi:diaminopimelate decarboxylase|nr:diaminopimelate decarboxylase [Clostridiales Family XIII bacterium]